MLQEEAMGKHWEHLNLSVVDCLKHASDTGFAVKTGWDEIEQEKVTYTAPDDCS